MEELELTDEQLKAAKAGNVIKLKCKEFQFDVDKNSNKRELR